MKFFLSTSCLFISVNAFVPLVTKHQMQQQQQQQQQQLYPMTLSSSSSSSIMTSSGNTMTQNTSPPPMAPLTKWGDMITNIKELQQQVRSSKKEIPKFAIEISAKDILMNTNDNENEGDNNDDNNNIIQQQQQQIQYFQNEKRNIQKLLQIHGAVIFRDFDLMKTQEGFQQFYHAIGMKPCLDPLHSVSARPTVDGKKNSPVYEAVNKESRKNFFIGMHNEFVGTRAPRAAAFVCFKAAEIGGEFIIADGRRIFRDLNTNLIDELYQRQIRYSVMELPFFQWIDTALPSNLQKPTMNIVHSLLTFIINTKVDFDIELLWNNNGYDNKKMLQARAPKQPPILIHPTTNEPTWFCNVHSHSSKLRKDREAIYGAERFEDGASQINKSDMFFGDDGDISDDQLKHMDEITKQHSLYVKMKEGDVVLLDNYKTMHGRNVFDGTRKHGVAWFEGWDGEDEMKDELRQELQPIVASH